MARQLVIIFLISELILLQSPTFGQAQWRSLFNGKDLQGWVRKGGSATYQVEKGEIVGRTVPNTPNTFLCTTEEFGDFIFEADLQVDSGFNSGIQFRSQEKTEDSSHRVYGYQMEIDPSPRAWSGGIYDEGRREWLYIPQINPAAKQAFRIGDWNHYRIEAIGPVLRTWVNGIPVSNLVDDLTPRGFIALQVHAIYGEMKPGMQIHWKNLRIQTQQLVPSDPDDIAVVNLIDNTLSPQEMAQHFRLLFNGKDLSGWRVIHSAEPPGQRWQVVDETLQVSPSDGSETGNDIVTTDQYGAFELIFDFRLTDGANSGVKYFVDEAYDSQGKSGIGLAYQLLDDLRHPDAKMGAAGNRTLASLYDLIPSYPLEKRFQRKIGEWNQGRIR
ncbi:MAG: DUF1080 domain-containing protein, partial [Chitinophagaceae bacterium]